MNSLALKNSDGKENIGLYFWTVIDDEGSLS